MIVLALDTSSDHGSVALASDGAVLASADWRRGSSHAENLLPQIERIFTIARIELSDINEIVVVIGPGSFTGLRVSINFARTVGYTHRIPIRPIPTDLALALQYQSQGSRPARLKFLLNAQQNTVFFSQWQAQDNGLVQVDALRIAELSTVQMSDSFVPIGSGWSDPELNLAVKPDQWQFPNSEFLALHACRSLINVPTQVWKEVQPLYLRAPSAEKALR